MLKTDIDAQLTDWEYASCHGPVPGIIAAAHALKRSIRFTDIEGYEDMLIAGAVHPVDGRVAWVHARGATLQPRPGYSHPHVAITFTLRIGEVETGVELPSYNQYFGCRVGHLAWHHDRITNVDSPICIYREKHNTYVLGWWSGSQASHVTITDDWLVVGNFVYHGSESPGWVERIALPDLDVWEPYTELEARERGVLPPGYEDANELRRKYPRP